jgi:hypothetical protein
VSPRLPSTRFTWGTMNPVWFPAFRSLKQIDRCEKLKLVGLSTKNKSKKFKSVLPENFFLPDRISGFSDHGQVLLLKNDSRLSFLIERIKYNGSFYIS